MTRLSGVGAQRGRRARRLAPGASRRTGVRGSVLGFFFVYRQRRRAKGRALGRHAARAAEQVNPHISQGSGAITWRRALSPVASALLPTSGLDTSSRSRRGARRCKTRVSAPHWITGREIGKLRHAPHRIGAMLYSRASSRWKMASVCVLSEARRSAKKKGRPICKVRCRAPGNRRAKGTDFMPGSTSGPTCSKLYLNLGRWTLGVYTGMPTWKSRTPRLELRLISGGSDSCRM